MKAIETNLDPAGATEISLLYAAKDSDLTAFEELIRRHDRQAFRLAPRITQNHEDAEDLVQEALLKAFRGLAQLQMKSRFSTWLFRITVNECLMKLRKHRSSQAISLILAFGPYLKFSSNNSEYAVKEMVLRPYRNNYSTHKQSLSARCPGKHAYPPFDELTNSSFRANREGHHSEGTNEIRVHEKQTLPRCRYVQ